MKAESLFIDVSFIQQHKRFVHKEKHNPVVRPVLLIRMDDDRCNILYMILQRFADVANTKDNYDIHVRDPSFQRQCLKHNKVLLHENARGVPLAPYPVRGMSCLGGGGGGILCPGPGQGVSVS